MPHRRLADDPAYGSAAKRFSSGRHVPGTRAFPKHRKGRSNKALRRARLENSGKIDRKLFERSSTQFSTPKFEKAPSKRHRRPQAGDGFGGKQ